MLTYFDHLLEWLPLIPCNTNTKAETNIYYAEDHKRSDFKGSIYTDLNIKLWSYLDCKHCREAEPHQYEINQFAYTSPLIYVWNQKNSSIVLPQCIT